MRLHLLILLLITVLVRGVMMISYPLSGTDDNQAGQNYLIDQLLDGNLLIGNLRFQTGYPFLIAPVVAFAQHFGRFDDRILLLVQSAISATIPFMVYDILRKQRATHSQQAEREAFIVALLILLMPFGWQWAHFYLPEWLIAFCLIFALWLLLRNQWSLRAAAGGGLVLGLASLMRVNVIPIIALLCVSALTLTAYSLRHRIALFLIIAGTSGALFFLYIVLIQVPSTGSTRISCTGGINLVYSNSIKGLPVRAENGANSAHYLDLLSMDVPQEITFFADSYDRWKNPGIWATPEEEQAFLDPNSPHPFSGTDYTLLYYTGLCNTDDLLRAVFFETLMSDPLRWISETLRFTLHTLVQVPLEVGIVSPPQALPEYKAISFDSGGILGFTHARGGYYTGQWVWQPGIWLYTALFPVGSIITWLIIPALIWALWSRHWFYVTLALMLIATALSLSAVSGAEPRVYAAVYPLWSILIGGMSAALLRRLNRARL
jgi:hypothetical protein